ncbi:class I SAM-dependent methyltransferase [Neiella sp. HB171785]|uniref:Class I SAM-dependent methyltransferase n=1 Tax=Neiella litorisoli TaxID=2771431 RepID=A0A8J6QV51_9GAMM|nr:class I SAM-dependent methyltransferase [Neiella litorisoli]MBD1390892.1 class I SAM-dependent methyltransferase [Neiella litorisoli]
MGFIKRLNHGLCRRVLWRLPQQLTAPLFPHYEQQILEHAMRLDGGVILDVGAGYLLPDSLKLAAAGSTTIIGMDILPSSLRKNRYLDAALVADACEQWPLADNSVDLVISRSVMEHLPNNDVFAREMFRVLKPGGVCVHVLPGKNAPFSLLNRMLPNSWTQKLVNWAFPERRGELGFVAYYHRCAYPEIRNLFENSGFNLSQIRFRYYQSSYYVSVFPVFLLSSIYDWAVWKLGVKRLASQLLIVAEKPPQND